MEELDRLGQGISRDMDKGLVDGDSGALSTRVIFGVPWEVDVFVSALFFRGFSPGHVIALEMGEK